MSGYNGKALARLSGVVETGKNLRVNDRLSASRFEEWYDRWADTLDLGFMPIDAADGSILVTCASCGVVCEERDWKFMAKHSVAAQCRDDVVIGEDTRPRFNRYIGLRIRQARLEHGVPRELLEMRHRFVLWRGEVLAEDEVKKLFKWLKKAGCRVGKIEG